MPPRLMKARKPAAPRVAGRRPAMVPVAPEHSTQVAVAAYLEVALLGVCPWTAIDAGQGRMSKASAGLRKRRGVKPDWPDFQVIWEGRYYGVELKRERYGSLTKGQEDLHAWLAASKASVCVCHSVEEVCAALTAWGIPVRVPLARLQGRAP